MDDLENMGKIPVIIVDQHHHTYKYIKEYIDKKILPKHDNTIIHLDAHIDELVPKDIQIRVQLESNLPDTISKLFHDIGTENWLKIATNDRCLKHVIWVKPPWAMQVEDCHKDLENSVTLDVKTLGKSVFENAKEDWEGFKSLFEKYLSVGDPYILDIEFSFFSSDNPFTSDYPDAKQYYSKLKDLFELKPPRNQTNEDIAQASKERNMQLQQLEELFNYLQHNNELPPLRNYNPEVYKKAQDFYQYLLQYYTNESINWRNIFSSGIECNDYNLPVHHTSCADIKKLLECVGNMLDILQSPPTLITIAIMCEYDQFTPQQTCDFISENLTEFFESRYENIDIQYEDY